MKPDDMEYGIDPNLVHEFIDESQDFLNQAANTFIGLQGGNLD